MVGKNRCNDETVKAEFENSRRIADTRYTLDRGDPIEDLTGRRMAGMPIGSPRVSLVNSILDTRGKGLEKLEENSPDSRIPLARYGWGKTSLTLESIFMRDLLEENVSKRNENFRTKIDRNPATRRSLFEKGRIERFTCIARNKIDAVGNNEREEGHDGREEYEERRCVVPVFQVTRRCFSLFPRRCSPRSIGSRFTDP